MPSGGGPSIGVGVTPEILEILLRIGDLTKASKLAQQEIKKLEQAFLKAEQKGKQVDKEAEALLRKYEAIQARAKAAIDRRDELAGMQSNQVFQRGAYGAVRNQFKPGHNPFDTADRFGNVLNKGNLLGFGARLAGANALLQVARQIAEIPDQALAFRKVVEDHRRDTISNPLRTRNEQLKADAAFDEKTLSAVPLAGGILGRVARFQTWAQQTLAGEDSLERVEKKVELDELVRRNPGISKEVVRRLTLAHVMDPGLEMWAKLMGNPSPAVERLVEDIKAADKLMKEGFKAAASGNITGNLRKGGAGGAQDFFNRANSLVPGMAPQNAAQTFADIEAGRVSQRNFARAQMTRVYRTGD